MNVSLLKRLFLYEYNEDAREAEIYMQGDGSYVAEICLDKVLPDIANPNTEIVIDGIFYYIQLDGKGAKFEPGNSVELNTSPIDTDGSEPLRKETVLEANKKYILTINIDASGAGTATLEEVTD